MPNLQQKSSTFTMMAFTDRALNDSLVRNAGSQSHNKRILGPFQLASIRAALANERVNSKIHIYEERWGDDGLGHPTVFLQIR